MFDNKSYAATVDQAAKSGRTSVVLMETQVAVKLASVRLWNLGSELISVCNFSIDTMITKARVIVDK